MLGHLTDSGLPTLTALLQTDLPRITGAGQTRLLRARYTPGERAILHVALQGQEGGAEGSIWFYAGDKAHRLARNLPDARLDTETGALFQAFPADHRMPHLATFVANAPRLAPALIGGPAAVPPVPMRYRPGLSATFRWTRTDGRVFFVKQTPDADVTVQALSVTLLAEAARHLPVAFTPVAGVLPDLGLIAYAAADGDPLDHCLARTDPGQAPPKIAQVIAALRALWSLPVVPVRVLDRPALLGRAEAASQMIGLFDSVAGDWASRLFDGLHARPAAVRLRPTHADMKLEHAFLSAGRTTLIDMESLSLGDPDHDLAKLDSRLTMAALGGQIPHDVAEIASREIRRHGGPDYLWFLTCARLQCAKYFAQRFDPATIPLMRRVLDLC